MASLGRYRKYLQLTDIALRMIVTIALGFFLGHRLDVYLGLKTPWLTVILGLTALAASIYQIVVRLNQLDKS